jgi:gas vesicle protein
LLFAAFNLEQSIMRTLVAFLLGLIIGGVAMLFLPDPRRDELNAEIRTQTEALQTQLRQFGDQLKGMKLPQPENSSPTPSPSATPK